MLVIENGFVCHLSNTCPYADNCWGARPDRDTKFTCSFVNDDGTIETGQHRNLLDKTGRMEIIME